MCIFMSEFGNTDSDFTWTSESDLKYHCFTRKFTDTYFKNKYQK